MVSPPFIISLSNVSNLLDSLFPQSHFSIQISFFPSFRFSPQSSLSTILFNTSEDYRHWTHILLWEKQCQEIYQKAPIAGKTEESICWLNSTIRTLSSDLFLENHFIIFLNNILWSIEVYECLWLFYNEGSRDFCRSQKARVHGHLVSQVASFSEGLLGCFEFHQYQ